MQMYIYTAKCTRKRVRVKASYFENEEDTGAYTFILLQVLVAQNYGRRTTASHLRASSEV